jgi:DNA mismatch endonuclease (patch repair protein)
MKKTYIRDGRAPIPEKESTSRVMSANKAKNTKPELTLRKALYKNGLRGYRLHWKMAPGRPDIAYPGKHIAVFVNGCFWHRCPHCNPSYPRTNVDFWKNKFQKNKERDERKERDLKNAGWKVFVFWECQIKKDVIACVNDINIYYNYLNKRTSP